MKSEDLFSRPWDHSRQTPSPLSDEINSRKFLINLVRGCWTDALQDRVFLHDEPTADAALALVQKYGVRRAGRLILKMNE